jgi:two-component sensor histidine kinase
VLPPPWLSWWAFCIYLTLFSALAWAGHRIYRSYAIERRAEELAVELIETEENAEHEIQEQIEYQDELLESAFHHKRETLALVESMLAPESKSADSAVRSSHRYSKRIKALKLLERSLFYSPAGPTVDLQKFADDLFAELLPQSAVPPETVITINQLPSMPLPADIGNPLAMILRELMENALQHAFDPASPVSYLQLSIEEGWDAAYDSNRITLVVGDSGRGITKDIFTNPTPGSGASIVCAIASRYEGEISVDSRSGAQVSVSLSEEALSPAALSH